MIYVLYQQTSRKIYKLNYISEINIKLLNIKIML